MDRLSAAKLLGKLTVTTDKIPNEHFIYFFTRFLVCF